MSKLFLIFILTSLLHVCSFTLHNSKMYTKKLQTRIFESSNELTENENLKLGPDTALDSILGKLDAEGEDLDIEYVHETVSDLAIEKAVKQLLDNGPGEKRSI